MGCAFVTAQVGDQPGHVALKCRVGLQRAEVSKYLFLPTGNEGRKSCPRGFVFLKRPGESAGNSDGSRGPIEFDLDRRFVTDAKA